MLDIGNSRALSHQTPGGSSRRFGGRIPGNLGVGLGHSGLSGNPGVRLAGKLGVRVRPDLCALRKSFFGKDFPAHFTLYADLHMSKGVRVYRGSGVEWVKKIQVGRGGST